MKLVEKLVEKLVIVFKVKKMLDGKLILGEKEWVYVFGLNENFRVCVDIGVMIFLISVVDVVNFECDGKDWVKFRIEYDNVKSDEISLLVECWVNIC